MSYASTLGISRFSKLNGAVPLALLVLCALPVFAAGLVSLVDAWSTPEYSHGPIIPLISLYLFLRELRDAPADRSLAHKPVDRRMGLLVIAIGLLIGVFGNVASIPDVITYGLIVWIAGLVLVCMGWDRGKTHQLPVLHLIFMLPLPQFLYWKMTIFLQGVSSELGVWFIMMANVPVFLDGNIIDLGVYKLLVAEACSGLRYLFPILSFSYLMAILYRGPFSHKALLFLMAAPLTVFMNSFRIGVIGVLVNSYGIGHAEGFLHFFEGWVIFCFCIGVLFLTAALLQYTTRAPKSLRETIDLDFDGLSGPMRKILALPISNALVASTALTVLVSVAFLIVPRTEQIAPVRDNFALFPSQLGVWSGVNVTLNDEIEDVLGADDYIQTVYTAPGEAASVSFFSAWYRSQTEGEGIHSPEVCLPGAGWEIFSLDEKEVTVPGTVYGTFTLNRAVVQKGLDQQMVYYWFEQRGQRMTNDFAAKINVMRDTLTIGRSDGAIVRFTTPILRGESEAVAEARLMKMMQDVLPRLPKFIPE